MMNFKLSEISLATLFMLSALASGAEYRVDTTYATNGAFRQVGGAVKGVIVQPSGKILLGASMTEAGRSLPSFALLRQNSNGVLDNTYDTDGIRFTDFGTSYAAYVSGMAESPVDGKIYMVGRVSGFDYSSGPPVYFSDFAVVSFNSDGSPNTDFNTTGKKSFSFDPITNPTKSFAYAGSSAECVAVQNDGMIVVGGWVEVGASDRRFALMRFQTNGAIDPNFSGGYVVTNPGAYCSISGIAISPNNQKIVVAGTYQDPLNYGWKNMIVRYNTNGTLDAEFDTDGMVFTGGGNQNHNPAAVAIQSDDKIVVGGSTYIKNPFAEPEDFALFRYNDNGSPDVDFGTGGFVAVDVVGGYDSIRAIKLLSGGKILAAGTAGGNPADPAAVGSLALLMFNSNGTLDTGFNNGGMVTSTGPSTREAYCIARQTDGKFIAAGEFLGENSNPGESASTRFEIVPPVVLITRKTDLLLGSSSSTTLGSNIYNTTGAGQTQTLGLGNKATKSAYIGIQNDGSAADSFKVKATPGNSNFTVKYFKGSKDITAAIIAGSYQTPSLAPKATEILKVTVTTNGARSAKKRPLNITASSVAKTSESDTALFKLTSKAKPKKK